MSTKSPFQGIVKEYGPVLEFPFDSTDTTSSPGNPLDQESLTYWLSSLNSGNGGLAPLAADGFANLFTGVTKQKVPVEPYGSDFAQGSGNQSPNPGMGTVTVVRNCLFQAKVTVGDSIKPLVAVYAGADAQTLTTVAGSNKVGFVSGEQPVIASAVSGQTFLVELRANYPPPQLG